MPRVIKALAHPSRLLIIDNLAEHEHSVGDLTSLIGSDMSTVSKHLSVLKNAPDNRSDQVRELQKVL